MKEFFIENRDTILVMIGGVISSILGVIQFFKAKKQEIQLEKLKMKLELEKNEKSLNNKENREAFILFVDAFIEMAFNKNNKSLEKEMKNIKKKLFIYGDGELITMFTDFIFSSQNTNQIQMFSCFENFVRKYREKISVSNEGLNEYGLLQLFVNENVNNHIAKLSEIK